MDSAISFRSSSNTLKPYWIVSSVLLCVVLCVVALTASDPKKYILYNSTLSLETGFYRLHHAPDIAHLQRDDIVVYAVPENVRSLVRDRQYLGNDIPLMKPYSASSGDYVCTEGHRVVVQEQTMGRIRDTDSQGRPLPWHRFCGRVPAGQFYSFSHHAASFDSRHYGPVPLTHIIAKATPLWTW